MPNHKDQDQGPDHGPDEEYSFLQETIKPKPISREKLLKEFVRIAIYGVVLGVFACLAFFALKPWAERIFQGEPETVTIPEDTEPSEEEQQSDTETEEEQVLDSQDYETLMSSIYSLAREAGKGVVSVSRASGEEDWTAEATGIRASVTGIITADNGQELLILADSSVCSKADRWTVTFADDSGYTATLKKMDRNIGLAVFSVPRNNITSSTWAAIEVAVLGNSNLVKRGDPVIALGNMYGYAGGYGYGTVSSTEYKDTFYDGECSVVATDLAAADRGTGVLFNMDGEVIGIAVPSIWESRGMATVNAYGISGLKSVIELLANGESVPYIGVSGTSVTAAIQEERGIPAGIYVTDVETDSPAMSAGIQIGDVICEVAGEDVTSVVTYQRALLETEAGSEITIGARRLGADGYVDVNFKVTVGSKE